MEEFQLPIVLFCIYQSQCRAGSGNADCKHGSIKSALAAIGQQGNELEFLDGLQEERLNHDFEFWAFTTVKIQDKQTKEHSRSKVNRGQRKTLARLENALGWNTYPGNTFKKPVSGVDLPLFKCMWLGYR